MTFIKCSKCGHDGFLIVEGSMVKARLKRLGKIIQLCLYVCADCGASFLGVTDDN